MEYVFPESPTAGAVAANGSWFGGMGLLLRGVSVLLFPVAGAQYHSAV